MRSKRLRRSRASKGGLRQLLIVVQIACVSFLPATAQVLPRTAIWKIVDTSLERSAQAAPTSPPAPKPAYPFLRYDEIWGPVCAAGTIRYSAERLKCLTWNAKRQSYLSLSGEAREVYETYQNQEWGEGPQDNNGWFLERYLLSADWHINQRSRLFSELQSGLENGRTGGPRSFDKDKLDLHQLFVDLSHGGAHPSWLVRLGRQELSYGSGRLVDARYGLNTRISFDGAKAVLHSGERQFDLFVTRPTFHRRGFFNDVPDGAQKFWGAYLTTPVHVNNHLDFYYFGLDRRLGSFNVGSGRYIPETLGARWSGKAARFDFDDESNVQFGRFAQGSIRAWSISTQHGYTPEFLDGRLRFAARVGTSSGDNHPSGRNLGTFNPLFPRGKYFQQADLNGPSNSISVLPAVEWHASKSITLTSIYGSFWRYSISDGLYDYAGEILRHNTTQTTGRHVGQLFEFDFQQYVTKDTTLLFSFEQFLPGHFLEQTPLGRQVRYVTFWYDYHF